MLYSKDQTAGVSIVNLWPDINSCATMLLKSDKSDKALNQS